jgi:hypothetical protein
MPVIIRSHESSVGSMREDLGWWVEFVALFVERSFGAELCLRRCEADWGDSAECSPMLVSLNKAGLTSGVRSRPATEITVSHLWVQSITVILINKPYDRT